MSLDRQLRALEHSELIGVAAYDPDLTYLFRHALVQDAAYSSLVKSDRRALHHAVAAVLEELFPSRLDELAPLLAAHYAEADDATRALHYYRQAGDRAMRLYANAEAAQHYGRALALADEVETSAAERQHLFQQRGRALELSGRFQEALANYIDMQLIAHERGAWAMEMSALSARATLHSTHTPLHDPAQAGALSLEALALVRARGDRAGEARWLWNLMLLDVFGGGGAAQAREYGERSLAIARELAAGPAAPREALVQLAQTLKDLFYAYLLLGDMASARRVRIEALERSRALGDRSMEAECLLGLGMIYFLAGDFPHAETALSEAYAISTSIHDPWGQGGVRAQEFYMYAEQGEVDEAFAAWQDALAMASQVGTFASQLIAGTSAALLYASLGALDVALPAARRIAAETRAQLPGWSAWPCAVTARLLLRQGDLDAAERLLSECCPGEPRDYSDRLYPMGAVAIAQAAAELALARGDHARAVAVVDDALPVYSRNATMFTFDLRHVKARALWSAGQRAGAYALLRETCAEAEAFPSRRALLFILPTLAEWAAQCGDESEARRRREQLRAVVAFVAAHIGDADLRQSFLRTPEAQVLRRDLPA